MENFTMKVTIEKAEDLITTLDAFKDRLMTFDNYNWYEQKLMIEEGNRAVDDAIDLLQMLLDSMKKGDKES